MHSIDEILIELVIRHDCVIIPSFGGFIAQTHPARIDVQNGVIFPPSKHLLFNRNLLHNDGLLISAFVDFNAVSYENAQQYISDFVVTVKNELNAGKRVEFEKIGTFHLNNEGTLIFEQNRYFNLLLEAYGLGQVIFVPGKLVEETEEIEVEAINEKDLELVNIPVEENTEIITNDKDKQAPILQIRRKRTWVKYAAAACFLPLAFYSYWIPAKTDVLQSGMITWNDLNPFSQKQIISGNGIHLGLTIPKIEKPIVTQTVHEEPSNTEPVISEETRIEPTNETPAINVTSQAKAQVIIGCFSSNSNAENLVKSLRNKGFDASIVPGGDLIRVSIGGANSLSEENTLTEKAKSLGFESWILK